MDGDADAAPSLRLSSFSPIFPPQALTHPDFGLANVVATDDGMVPLPGVHRADNAVPGDGGPPGLKTLAEAIASRARASLAR